MLGDLSQSLVAESQRSLLTKTLLTYSDTTVRALIRESNTLSAALEAGTEAYRSQLEPDQGTIAELTIAAIVMQRNMRALLVYHQQRIDTLKEKYWERGGVLSAAFGADTDTRKHMAPVDEGFVKSYADLCLEYKTSWFGDDYEDDGNGNREEGAELMDVLDLTGGGVDADPPRDLFVSVRVVKDVGEVETASGTRLNLSKGSQYYLAREDVEGLLVQGFLEIID